MHSVSFARAESINCSRQVGYAGIAAKPSILGSRESGRPWLSGLGPVGDT